MFKEIIRYLSQDDIIEEDRQSYTRELYNCVNVFGITCTSRDRFTQSQLQELGKYGIESVDIRKQGIDVVIVDEVSKSSFLDLLIPILYGKTIILVGDHRQLPPMYDLRHLRSDDFDGLDEAIITKEKNEEYTALYEECFFKTLYEKVPDDFRVMLTKQYRCHSHIMEVFNHFYGGTGKGLTIGKKQQDVEKEHGLTVKINGQSIIDPKYHVYFIDCDQKESSAYEGSTSKINEQEAEVAMKLLRELDLAASDLVKQGKIRVSGDKKIDERPSIGVICTYGDQAGLIKKKRRSLQFNGFSGKPDERLIISTVDDFQGDERDIIILSMVRNPSGNRFDAEFIKKFERINVALSRARKLLIIVGARKFLSEAGVIDLPDLSGDKSRDQINFHVYEKIIDTIYSRGRVLVASDIIGG
jgi:superfamily I DNA and/or RNA helicase